MSSPSTDSSISPPTPINTSTIRGRKPINAEQENIYPDLSLETSLNDVGIHTDDEENENEINQQSDKTFTREKSLSINNLSSNLENDESNSSNVVKPVLLPIPEMKTTAVPIEQKPIKSNNWVLIGIVISLLFAVYIACDKNSEIAKKERGIANCSAFLNIDQFPKQNVKLWNALKTGIEGTFNDEYPQPSVFTLFSDDKDTMRNIMSRIVGITQECTHSTEYPLNISNTDLSTSEFREDHTKLILNFKDKLVKRKVMILNDIDKVPTTVIPSLHSFCDTINPLVAKSIIFLTIHVPEEPSGKPVEFIQNYLEEQWKDLPSNILGPLITRMLDQTFFLKKEDD